MWCNGSGSPDPVVHLSLAGSYTFEVVLDDLSPIPPKTQSLPSTVVAAAYWRRKVGLAKGCQARSAGSLVATTGVTSPDPEPPSSSPPPPASRTAATTAATATPNTASSTRGLRRASL